jgi:hypothetical protein
MEERKFLKQPLIAIATGATAVVLVTLSSLHQWGSSPTSVMSPGNFLLAACLAVAILLAYQFPIYIRHNTKICIMTVPLFLMAALLPPPLAGAATLLAVFGSEAIVSRKRGTHLVDMLTMASRWCLTVLAGALVAHLKVPSHDLLVQSIPVAGAALVMWAGDLFTLPLGLTPICGERPMRIIKTTLHEGGLAEAAQYVLGFLGYLLATRQEWALLMLILPTGLVHLAFKKEMDSDTFQLLENMADNVDMRGSYTSGHSKRVSELVEGVLNEIGMHGQEARQILTAARLHDLGKIGLPDQLLITPGALSPEDQAVMESYVTRGKEMMEAYPDFSRGIEMVFHHHEHWDGSGYPSHLAGTDIPFGARVIAVADSYDAMTSERPHRRALNTAQAAEILCNGAGRQWDPHIVQAFLTSIGHHLDTPLTAALPQPEFEHAVSAGRRVTA